MDSIIEPTSGECAEYVQSHSTRRSLMTNTRQVDALNQQLLQLVALACLYPAYSLQRRQKLTELVRVVIKSGKVWKENTPYYNDALQQTWLYFCRNPEQYNPEPVVSSPGSTIASSGDCKISASWKPRGKPGLFLAPC